MTTKLDELKALMTKATPGPWAVDPDDRPKMEWNNHIVGADTNFTVCFMTHDNTPENVEGFANADLIASGINALPALIAAVEALKAMRTVMDLGPKPEKLDAALSWRQCDEKARAMADAALASFGE